MCVCVCVYPDKHQKNSWNVCQSSKVTRTHTHTQMSGGLTCGRCPKHQRSQPLVKHQDYKGPVTPVCAELPVEAFPHRWGGMPCHLYLRAAMWKR